MEVPTNGRNFEVKALHVVLFVLWSVVAALLGYVELNRSAEMDEFKHKLTTVAEVQATRTRAVQDLDTLKVEFSSLKSTQELRSVNVESLKSQVLNDVLAISKLEKQIDLMQAQINDLRYERNNIIGGKKK